MSLLYFILFCFFLFPHLCLYWIPLLHKRPPLLATCCNRFYNPQLTHRGKDYFTIFSGGELNVSQILQKAVSAFHKRYFPFYYFLSISLSCFTYCIISCLSHFLTEAVFPYFPLSSSFLWHSFLLFSSSLLPVTDRPASAHSVAQSVPQLSCRSSFLAVFMWHRTDL